MGWLSGGYQLSEGMAPDGSTIHILPSLAPNPALDAWTILSSALGLAVFGFGITQYFKLGSSKLAIVQITLGALIIGSLIWFTGWVEWDYSPYTQVLERYGEIEIYRLPGWLTRLTIWKLVSFILGPGVIITGIVQLVKTKT